jgi:hypothetical protein
VALLAALLGQLPAAGEAWDASRREGWFQLARHIIATPQKGTPRREQRTTEARRRRLVTAITAAVLLVSWLGSVLAQGMRPVTAALRERRYA